MYAFKYHIFELLNVSFAGIPLSVVSIIGTIIMIVILPIMPPNETDSYSNYVLHMDQLVAKDVYLVR